jgi:hypothetical protein
LEARFGEADFSSSKNRISPQRIAATSQQHHATLSVVAKKP